MSEVEIGYGESATDTAVLLLAAAEELEVPVEAIRTTSFASFTVPEEVAKKAFGRGWKKRVVNADDGADEAPAEAESEEN